MPVAEPDDHAPPADRAAARDGAPARRLRRCSEALLEQYEYDGIETCAADGSCKRACPVAIDTGTLIKDLRRRQHSARAERAALAVAQRYGAVERAARGGLRAGRAGRRHVG